MKVRISDISTPANSSQNTGLYTTRNLLPLLSRILLSALFLWAAYGKITNPAGTMQFMASAGMPLPGLFLPAAIVLLVIGGLSLLTGIYARWGAIALIVFLIPATLIFHTNFAESMQQTQFFKNLAILGGLLMIVQYGPGNTVIRWGDRR